MVTVTINVHDRLKHEVKDETIVDCDGIPRRKISVIVGDSLPVVIQPEKND